MWVVHGKQCAGQSRGRDPTLGISLGIVLQNTPRRSCFFPLRFLTDFGLLLETDKQVTEN